jgi:hypothetical protein
MLAFSACKVFDKRTYTIIFTATELSIEVTAIAHAKRKPGYWLNRVARRP